MSNTYNLRGLRAILCLISLAIIFCACKKTPATAVIPVDNAVRAVDISFLPQIRKAGFTLKNTGGNTEDMLITLKNSGVNTFRIRLWVNPVNGYSGTEEVNTLSKEIKNMGCKVWLTVHYSDTWADPGSQTKPAAWAGLSFDALKTQVYNYTRKIVQDMAPDYIQIGNEINNGFLWPEGSYTHPIQFKQLLQQGTKAVRDASTHTKILLHYAGHEYASSFFDNMTDLDYDYIALSYYPMWHGKSLDALQASMQQLTSRFNKDILLAETSYPFTFNYNDATTNIVGSADQILPAYPATPQGQYDYLLKIRSIIKATTRVAGFCYWGGEWVAFRGPSATDGSSYENQALWGFNGQALPALKAFQK